MTAMTRCIATFVIGLFAGICAVFVPRMGGLLADSDMSKITLFPVAFVLLGLAYAAIVGIVVAIIDHGKQSTPNERFMTALGVPALLAGAISATAHSGQVQRLQATSERLAGAAVEAASIRKDDSVSSVTPLSAPKGSASAPEAMLELLLAVRPAYAQAAPPGALGQKGSERWTGWSPTLSEEHKYAIIVRKTATAQSAQLQADQLKGLFPGAQAVKTGDGFGVMTGVKSESSAVLEAMRIKRDLKIEPELLRVK